MAIIKYLKKIRDNYIINQVNSAEVPNFTSSSFLRKRLIFSGRVQNVGFRFQVYLMAKRLGLTGWVKNREDKSVEAEIQGEEQKINFLIDFMKSLIRISIKSVDMKEIPIIEDDKGFRLIK